jgi:SAM-dependent methyltransferase
MSTAPLEACPVCEQESWQHAFRRLGWDFVSCAECGLMRLDPIPTEAQLAAHYEGRAAGGNYEIAKSPERDAGLEQVLEFAIRAGATGKRLFDVGCFDGRLLDLALARGWDGWGLELQGEAVAEAQSKHPDRIFESTLEAFQAPAVLEVDLVTAVGLIEHLRDPLSLFSLASSILRPGGMLVIQTPNRESLPARALGRFWPPIAPPEHTFYFGRSTLTRLSARHGFAPVRTRAHVKKLRVGYAYEQFEHFGPEFHRLLGPVVRRLPARALDAQLPLYGGEMLFAARHCS